MFKMIGSIAYFFLKLSQHRFFGNFSIFNSAGRNFQKGFFRRFPVLSNQNHVAIVIYGYNANRMRVLDNLSGSVTAAGHPNRINTHIDDVTLIYAFATDCWLGGVEISG
jgi:hypothetical protein